MVITTAQDISMAYGSQILLKDANLTINAGERIGMVGKNGTGKSTFLKIMARTLQPDSGELINRRGQTVGFVAQECKLDNEKTVIENIRQGASRIYEMLDNYESGEGDMHQLEIELSNCDGWDIDNHIKIAMQSLSAPPADKLCANLSGGERRRVAICQAIISHPDLLILDEPTNHLDTGAIEWLEKFLLGYSGTVFFVTHDRYFLDQVCSRVVELDKGTLHSYNGNYSKFLIESAKREAAAELMEGRRQSFVRREIDWIRRGPKARGTKSKSRIERFNQANEAKYFEAEKEVDLIIPPPPKLGNIIVDLNEVTMERGGKKLFDDMTFTFERGTKVGIVGKNGTGKSTLLKLILGQLEPTSGSIRVGDNTKFNYVDQERLQLDGTKTVLEEIADEKDYVQLGEERISVWGYLKRFLFEDERINTKVNLLSGGEKNRLLLAKMLKHGGNFLILDEPTNDLDLATLRVLEEALEWFPGCVLVVSHDRYFLNRVCTHVIAFEENASYFINDGDFDYYMAKKGERDAAVKAAADAEKKRVAAEKAKPAEKAPIKKLSWSEKQEFESIEEVIMVAEGKVEELETKFAAPDFHTKHGNQTIELSKELEAAKTEVAKLYKRWDELSARA